MHQYIDVCVRLYVVWDSYNEDILKETRSHRLKVCLEMLYMTNTSMSYHSQLLLCDVTRKETKSHRVNKTSAELFQLLVRHGEQIRAIPVPHT